MTESDLERSQLSEQLSHQRDQETKSFQATEFSHAWSYSRSYGSHYIFFNRQPLSVGFCSCSEESYLTFHNLGSPTTSALPKGGLLLFFSSQLLLLLLTSDTNPLRRTQARKGAAWKWKGFPTLFPTIPATYLEYRRGKVTVTINTNLISIYNIKPPQRSLSLSCFLTIDKLSIFFPIHLHLLPNSLVFKPI